MSAPIDTTLRSATISVLVENEAGVLARVIGLFSGRGYNIESLTVAPVDDAGQRSRINIVTSGTEMVIAQIKAQLDRLVPVYRVADLTQIGAYVASELALVKVIAADPAKLAAAKQLAEAHGAQIADETASSLVFEITGSSGKLDGVLDLLRPHGLAEVSRTGVAAMTRGTKVI